MDRFHSRREKLRSTWKAAEIDALLVSAPSNVSYLTGFSGDSSVLLVGRDRDLIVSDGRFTTQLEQECPGLEARIRLPGQDMNPAVADVLRLMGLTRVGFEATHLTVADHEALALAAPGVALVGLTGQVEALRQIKDEGEIAAIREAIGFAERAFQMLRAGLREGETRKGCGRRARGVSASMRCDRGEFPADRGGGGQCRFAPRSAECDHPDRRRRFRAG